MKTLTTSAPFISTGGVVAKNGFLLFTVPQNTSIIAGGQLYSNVPTILQLDAGGLLIANQQLVATDEMNPQLPYTVVLQDSNRSRLDTFGPWAIVGASPIDISTIVSTSTGIAFPGAVLLNPVGNQVIATGNLTLTSGSFIETATPATGTGGLVRANGATLVTPNLGVATASSINKVTLTAPATGSTITIADGKTFTVNQNLTLAGVTGKTLTIDKSLEFDGTDGTKMTFPATSATIARTDAANTFTGHQTIEGVTSTGATGSGKFVFDTAPVISSPTFNGAITSGTMIATGSVATCNTGAGVGAACNNTITWGATLSSANYRMLCELDSPNVAGGIGNTGSKGTTTAVVSTVCFTAGTAVSSGTVRCVAIV